MLWYVIVPAGIAVTLAFLGWLGERGETYSHAVAEAWAKAEPEPPPPEVQPMDFWVPLAGSPDLFVFTVDHPFVAGVTRVLPRGLVVTDLLGEALFIDYARLQYRPATAEDVHDEYMVITPPEEEEPV